MTVTLQKQEVVVDRSVFCFYLVLQNQTWVGQETETGENHLGPGGVLGAFLLLPSLEAVAGTRTPARLSC